MAGRAGELADELDLAVVVDQADSVKSLPSADRYFTTAPPVSPVTLSLRISGGAPAGLSSYDTLRIRPATPTSVFVSARLDSAGQQIGDSAAFSASDTTLAKFWWNRVARRVEIYDATSAGVLTVTARAKGLTATLRLPITAATVTQPPPVDTTTPPPTGSTVVQLPRVYLSYGFPVTTRTLTVNAGGSLQAAIDSARRGDEIVLAAGATFSGNFSLPVKVGSVSGTSGWIVVCSSQLGSLPAAGTRVAPADAALMPKVVTPNGTAALYTIGATSGWWFAGIEVTVASAYTGQNYGLVALGVGSAPQTSLGTVPQDLVLDRVYIHGQTTSNLSRCVALNSGRSQITDSYLSECHGRGFDSQAILGWNGPGPYKIVNNMLSGAGENVMFGGADPNIAGLVPSDIEIRRNHIYKPGSWIGTLWTVKNLLELKNSARVLIEQNVLEGSWPGAQGGIAVLFRSTNQDGNCRWCRSTDVTFRHNLIRNTGGGIGFAGPDVHPVDSTLRRVLVFENVIDTLNRAPYVGDNARAYNFSDGARDITIERNVTAGTLYQGMRFDKDRPSVGVVLRDLVLPRGQYGIGSDGFAEGTAGLDAGAPGYVWSNVSLISAPRTGYPAGTSWVASESAAPLAATIRALVTAATQGVVLP